MTPPCASASIASWAGVCRPRSLIAVRIAIVALAFAAMCLLPARADARATADPTAGEPQRIFLPLAAVSRPPNVFGVQMYGTLGAPYQYISRAQPGGVAWVRFETSWQQIEPVNTEPSEFNYSVLDESVSVAQREGLQLILTIGSNPPWAATYRNGPIDKVEIGEFVQYVVALVERYDGDGWQDAPGSPPVKHWELYNEPDGGSVISAELGSGAYWGHYGAEYAAMLCALYPAVKAADSEAQILLGGIAYDHFIEDNGAFVRGFIDDVLWHGGGACVDMMNFHYYPYFEARWAPYGDGLAGKAAYLRDRLSKYNLDHLPMVVTEAGHHSNDYADYPSTPEEQASYVLKLFVQSMSARLEFMIWWTWVDLPPSSYWGTTGLLTATGETKPAYLAYQQARARLGQSYFRRELPPGETGNASARVYQFNGNRTFYVAWSTTGIPQTIRIPGTEVVLTDLYGHVQGATSDSDDGSVDGYVRVTVDAQPKYVEPVR